MPDFLVLAKDFERMLYFVASNVRPKSLMETLHRDLSYLAAQARRNPDRSLPEENEKRWASFMREFQKTGMLSQLKNKVESWSAVEAFVSPKPKTMNVKILKLPAHKPLDWQPEDFLRKLFHETKSNPKLGDQEKMLVLLALKYLQTEGEKKPERRDQEWLKKAWRAAHPILEISGILLPYKKEKVIARRMKDFIGGER